MSNPKKNLYLIISILSFVGIVEAKGRQSTPNILILTTEDISSYLGCYGDTLAQTPFLDKLASEGVRYTRMYTTVGVCAPSRYSLITGRYSAVDGAKLYAVRLGTYFERIPGNSSGRC